MKAGKREETRPRAALPLSNGALFRENIDGNICPCPGAFWRGRVPAACEVFGQKNVTRAKSLYGAVSNTDIHRAG